MTLFSRIFWIMVNCLVKNKRYLYLIAGIFSILWMFFYFNDLLNVPLHPDESTQIFMSKDVELIINNTSDLYFQKDTQNSIEQNYRLLDAPLPKYFIGLFRIIFKLEAIPFDWDWSKSWTDNQIAIPGNQLLLISRLSAAIFFPLSIVLFALILKEVFKSDNLLIFLSLMLFAFNSLLLLHTRRAMAESSMIFFLLLSLLTLCKIPKKWFFLSSVPIAFAINAKQILIFLILLAIILLFFYFKKHLKNLVVQITLFFVLLVGILFILNPIAWKQPVQVAKHMFNQRMELSQNQAEAIESVSPEFLTNSAPKRIIAFIAQLFILQPSPQEVSNYQEYLNKSIVDYFKNPLHRGLIRNLFGGAIYLVLFLFGLYKSISSLPIKFKLIFLSGFILFSLEILLTLAIPFQRYYLPAIPFTIIFAMIGLEQIIKLIKNSSIRSPIKL
ncbi:MAG: phospholipid carrier-dependent glycosyltransferase [Anaerolineaceae bacterium]|nr:phospholipid carrier-dependent glycosyltransferase [Anaerolineaceae bacterium]